MLKQVLTGTITGSGKLTIGSLTKQYTVPSVSLIDVNTNDFLLPASGAAGYYLVNGNAYTVGAPLVELTINVNGTAVGGMHIGPNASWASPCIMLKLANSDRVSFNCTGSYGTNFGASFYIQHLFVDETTVYDSPAATFRVSTATSSNAGVSVPFGTNSLTQYGTKSNITITPPPIINHLATDGALNASFVSSSFEHFGSGVDRTIDLVPITNYGSTTVAQLQSTASSKHEVANVLILIDQANGLNSTLTPRGTFTSMTSYSGSSLGIIKF